MRRLLERGLYFNLTETLTSLSECYRARTNRKKVADILSQEIKKIKERYPYLTRNRTRCCSKAIVGQTRRKLIF